MKEDSLFVLFCFYLWDPPNWDASDCVLGLLRKLSRRRGALAWFPGVWTCAVEILESWMISSLKIKLKFSWKFRRNWNVPLVFLERSWCVGFNGIYLVRFGFRMWEILIFKWFFLLLKIQKINSKKPGFGRKIQLRTCLVTLEGLPFNSIQAWFPFIFGCSKNQHTLQNTVHMLSFPIL
jgi:hypothetical protein